MTKSFKTSEKSWRIGEGIVDNCLINYIEIKCCGFTLGKVEISEHLYNHIRQCELTNTPIPYDYLDLKDRN